MTVSRTICLGFLAVIAIGTGLLLLPFSTSTGEWNSWIVALFTATSAVCVTGHIVVDTGTYFSPVGHFFILALIQIGGLGYMVATTFLLLLLGRKFGLRDKIALQQALDRSKLQGGSQLVKSIIATILLFEITGILLMALVFMPQYGSALGLWYAIFHSISAWNNAGFSLFSDNLMGFQTSLAINIIVSCLVILGGLGYETIFEAYLWLRDRVFQRTEQRRVFSLHFRVVTSTTLFLLLLGTFAFYLTESRNPGTLQPLNFGQQVLAAWFQSMTARTAGFNTIDVGKMTTAGLFITIAMMFVGASPGGTGGGIKTTTLRVLSSCTKAILQGKEEVFMYERQVPHTLILKAIGVVVGSLMTVALTTTLVAFVDPGVDFIQILFEVVSAFATVGLSTGITASLSATGKILLVITMYIGRVGILLLMAALLGDPKPSAVHYPEENLLVG
ncbi:ATPase [Synechococcales cyanobacterium C]|uniref:ATPase n=1 Tax=Petrachloros mirabilis ULC683 TaxID=2781853 RepID=A0A8K2A0X3_9CYAN|nr:TrkH family potassium uptake protein [Petrachloros mirabilis]NCJ08448.1 ATPase [Petrachloros mirabilis ULC683]